MGKRRAKTSPGSPRSRSRSKAGRDSSLVKCPKCNGEGVVSYVDPIAGDWHDSGFRVHECSLCNGTGKVRRGDLGEVWFEK